MKAVFVPLISLLYAHAFSGEKELLPTAHITRNIEGWTVRVDDRLLSGDGAGVGERALKLLSARLVASTMVVLEASAR